MKESNVISLVEHIENKKKLDTNYVPQKVTSNNKMLIKRVYSFIIDVALVFTLHSGILSCFALFVSDFFQSTPVRLKFELLSVSFPYQLALFITSYLGYFMFSQVTLGGQTIGQKVYKLKVLNESNQPVDSFKVSALRSIAYLSYYLGCGIFQLIYFSNRKSFADIISKTHLSDSTFESDEIVEVDIDSLKIAS